MRARVCPTLPAWPDVCPRRTWDGALCRVRSGSFRARKAARAGPFGARPPLECVVSVRPDGRVRDEVAAQVGVSRVTAWRYLERLADEGTVTRNTDYGKAGRPKTRYQWR